MEFEMTTRIVIVPGTTRVRFTPPRFGGDDYESKIFFDTYRDKLGTIVDYCTKHVGLFDFNGRLPGVYVDISALGPEFTPFMVLFDGEKKPKAVKVCHMTVIDGGMLVTRAGLDLISGNGFVRDLPNPISFYRGDTVRVVDDLLQTSRTVLSEQISATGEVSYLLEDLPEQLEKRRSEGGVMAYAMESPAFRYERGRIYCEHDLVLLKRGFGYYLYKGKPADLTFESVEREAAFWAGHDLSRSNQSLSESLVPRSLASVLKEVEAGRADAIRFSGKYVIPMSYEPVKLRLPFKRFADRARAASSAYWKTQPDLTKKAMA